MLGNGFRRLRRRRLVSAFRAETGRALEAELQAEEGTFTFVAGDITNSDDCARAVAAVIERHGRIDVLVNNAANTVPTGRIENTTDDEWFGTLNPDLTGT